MTISRTPSIDQLSLAETDAPVHELQEKNLKYWTTRFLFLIKSIQGKKAKAPKKKRKASYESVFGSSYDGDLDGEDAHIRVKPEALNNLCQITKFSRRELQLMYRGFKQECPTGFVKEETFQRIYAQFFPRGADTSQYAHFVFNSFDPNRTGVITFTDFVIGLSNLARGSTQEKLRWVFSLYDLDGDGVISRNELYRIICAVYDLLGRPDPSPADEAAAMNHANQIFDKFDINRDGVVTVEEFLKSCLRDDYISKALSHFNTIL